MNLPFHYENYEGSEGDSSSAAVDVSEIRLKICQQPITKWDDWIFCKYFLYYHSFHDLFI